MPETYQQCVARVKRDYPVPPGNINAQNQMIHDECDGLARGSAEADEQDDSAET